VACHLPGPVCSTPAKHMRLAPLSRHIRVWSHLGKAHCAAAWMSTLHNGEHGTARALCNACTQDCNSAARAVATGTPQGVPKLQAGGLHAWGRCCGWCYRGRTVCKGPSTDALHREALLCPHHLLLAAAGQPTYARNNLSATAQPSPITGKASTAWSPPQDPPMHPTRRHQLHAQQVSLVVPPAVSSVTCWCLQVHAALHDTFGVICGVGFRSPAALRVHTAALHISVSHNSSRQGSPAPTTATGKDHQRLHPK
jgi:hypothetical protein